MRAAEPDSHRGRITLGQAWGKQARLLGLGKKDILLTRSHFLAKKKEKLIKIF